MIDKNIIQDLTIEELRQGYYVKSERFFSCIFCDSDYNMGEIYEWDSALADAELSVRMHIRKTHGSSLKKWIEQDKGINGLSATQKEIIKLLSKGLSDGEIAKQMGNKAKSTIRNHRFTLREKYRESKVFISIMEELAKVEKNPEEEFVTFHPALSVSDDRTKITQKEKSDMLKKYFDGKKLLHFPKKQKIKLILLQHISGMFEAEKIYSEKEVNEIIKIAFDDYVTIRRYLIEYSFMDRKRDGTQYWTTC